MRNVNVDPRLESGDTVRVPSLQPSPLATGSMPAAAGAKKVAVLGPTLRFKGELSAEEDFADAALATGMNYDDLLERILQAGLSYQAAWREA